MKDKLFEITKELKNFKIQQSVKVGKKKDKKVLKKQSL